MSEVTVEKEVFITDDIESNNDFTPSDIGGGVSNE